MTRPPPLGGGPSGRPGGRNVVYRVKGNLYVNLTHRCDSACVFCHRLDDPSVAGADLYLPPDAEPSAAETLEAVERALAESPAGEIVFCGYGEPTLRWDVLVEIARALRTRRPGLRLRLNTNGHGSLIQKRSIVAEAAGVLDAVSVSLNAADADTYQRLCPNSLGPEVYRAVCSFIRDCAGAGLDVVATAVRHPDVDLEATRRKAETLGAKFESRPLDDVRRNFYN